MKIALAQISCIPGDVKSNCSTIVSFAEKAANQECEVVIFPEMTDTGYDTSLVHKNASTWPGLPYSTCQETAARLGIFIICGLSERIDNDIYNSVGVFSQKGELIGKYRKMHLFSIDPINEYKFFKPGTSITTVKIGELIWGFSICYDLRFPEIYRMLAIKGAQILVSSTAWPKTRAFHWELLTRARAIENQAYFLGANRVGKDGKVPFCGKSCIIEPFGDYAAQGSDDNEGLLTGMIDKNQITSFRKKIPVFDNRRDDIYGNYNL